MGRRYKLVIFDIDGTITRHISSWRYIHERLGLWDVLAHKYQEQFSQGKISYRRFCELDAAHWRGIKVATMRRIFREIPYSKNVVPCIRYLKARGFRLVAVSTGIQFITERVERELDFDCVIGNQLISKEGVLTGGVKIRIGHGSKGTLVDTIAGRFNVKPREMICVGDSDGDVPLARRCGFSIAFNCTSAKLERAADYVCRTKDFNEIKRAVQKLIGEEV